MCNGSRIAKDFGGPGSVNGKKVRKRGICLHVTTGARFCSFHVFFILAYLLPVTSHFEKYSLSVCIDMNC